jgi:hypothetical protein
MRIFSLSAITLYISEDVMDEEVLWAFAEAIYDELMWLLQDYTVVFPQGKPFRLQVDRDPANLNNIWIGVYGSSIIGAEISFYGDSIHMSYRPIGTDTSNRETKTFPYSDPELAVTMSEFIKKHHRKD